MRLGVCRALSIQRCCDSEPCLRREVSGRAAIADTWDVIFTSFPDWTVKVTDVLVDGDRIAFIGSAGVTDRNGRSGQPATGKRIEYRAVIF